MRKKSNKYFITDYQLFRRCKNGQPQRVILPDQTELILFNLHKDLTEAHLGIETTYEKLKERYYWPQMYESVRRYVQQCDACQRRGAPNRKEKSHPIAVKGPFHQIGIDIKGPLPITTKGNRYLIVVMDYLTKWLEAKPLKQVKAIDVAEFIFKEIISRHGVPEVILTDRGTEFNNQCIIAASTHFGLISS